MSSANLSPMLGKHTDSQAAVAEEIRHIRDLVFVRNLLEARGASSVEVRECDAVIDECRRRLAVSAKRASAPLAA